METRLDRGRELLAAVGTGRISDVLAALDSLPELVNVVAPHPFWGGRAQPLHVAIEGGRRDLFDLLLERGASPSGHNDGYERWSPLMIAIGRGQEDMRDELLRRGARVGLVEALMLADDERVEELLGSGELPIEVPGGGSLLAFARTPDAIDRLIGLGAHLEASDRWGASPMDALSRLGARGRPLVQHLIRHGAVPEPKHLARLGDVAALGALLAHSPAIASDDAVMMGAVDGAHHELVRTLLSKGANVNARADAPSRHTAAHAAAWNGDLEMVKQLGDAGADLSARDSEHQATPRDWAETALQVTNNPRCLQVIAYLDAR
jgi:ankyrin repeat protein